MRCIIKYLKPYFGYMLIGLGVKFMGTILELLLPYILEHMLDDIVPARSLSRILLWGALMILTAALVVVFNIVANRRASKVARSTVVTMRRDLFSKTLSLSGTDFDEVGLPSLISRMTSDTYTVQNFVGMIQRMGVRAPILLVGGIIVSSLMDPFLALILICIIPILALIVFFVSMKGVPLFFRVQEKLDRLTLILRENITGVRVVKALSKADYEATRYNKANDELVHADLKAGITMAVPNPVLNLFLNIGLTLVVIFGARRVDSGIMKPGVILAFLTYFNMILQSVMAINRMFMNYTKAGAGAGRIEKVLNIPSDALPVESEEHFPGINDDALFTFRDVSFSYPVPSDMLSDDVAGDRENCLNHISFSLKKGESLGIIGATGSGKTTVINLLMRFYDVTSGEIFHRGRNIRTMELSELRKPIGVVFQNDIIFADTLRENVAFGTAHTDAELLAALSDAGLSDFVEALPEGLDYPLKKAGVNLSGGQRQRTLIARALAANPELLILDDASSALDYKTDAELRKALREHHPELTTITIAQRISSIKDMTHILVLEEGNAIGYGTHAELLASCETYREIYEAQTGRSATEDAAFAPEAFRKEVTAHGEA